MSSYRFDIDVLRAFAVIAVIVFHSANSLLPNGYLGVDIFFVISGFIITKNLSEIYLKNGKFSIINFYVRRIKRIYPLLILVVLISLISLSIILASSIHTIFLTGGYSLFGISNIFFIFNEDSNRYLQEIVRNPLMHTWSLGIEQKFYIVFPIILALIIKFYKFRFINFASWYFCLLTVLGLANFLFFTDQINFSNSFYSPIARFWEITAGSTFYFISKNIKVNSNVSNYLYYILFSFLILLVIFSSYLGLRYNYEIALTVFLTCFLIYFLTFSKKLHIFNISAFSYLGKLSFGIYLWHMPVLFLLQLSIDNNYLNIIFTFLISLLLSFLSYKFIENPIRYSTRFDIYLKRLIPVVPVLVIVLFINIQPSWNLFNYLVTKSEHLTTRNFSIVNNSFSEKNTDMSQININNNNGILLCKEQDLNFDNNHIINNCFIEKNEDSLVHIMGDSTVLSFIPMLLNSSIKSDIILSSRTGALFAPNVNYINDFSLPDKEKFKLKENFIENSINLNQNISPQYTNNIVIISSIFVEYMNRKAIIGNNDIYIDDDDKYNFFQDQLGSLVEKFDGDYSIIFIPDVYTPKFNLDECMSWAIAVNNNCHNPSIDNVIEDRKSVMQAIQNIDDKFDNVYVFDLIDTLCNEKCNYFYKGDSAFINDRFHYTIQASKFLSESFDAFLLANNILN